ncbi:uncharacterized protein PGTG_09178 [Puccinia graminis f. sp. tritici CRL 75-36-700-3]|uniref:Uncharacterized protein n=1 Tax=Puccinia graminis f. sp. tritici (strain CRL 75-36-700-3 / race SCCL) TaxID=418459 RepID=E3KFU0_PUCGT|nr:uncharacterized protein PGTG_09178 [Puccinia graminis f. sp. tritici CRL 75-36-700-3]EFP83225.1 hypothetical protein PGTG_09178 [Puccinia graminis f. sp. tritici CRL 75-36-700-3]
MGPGTRLYSSYAREPSVKECRSADFVRRVSRKGDPTVTWKRFDVISRDFKNFKLNADRFGGVRSLIDHIVRWTVSSLLAYVPHYWSKDGRRRSPKSTFQPSCGPSKKASIHTQLHYRYEIPIVRMCPIYAEVKPCRVSSGSFKSSVTPGRLSHRSSISSPKQFPAAKWNKYQLGVQRLITSDVHIGFIPKTQSEIT